MEKWLIDVYASTHQPVVPDRVNGRPTTEVVGDYYEKQGAKWEADVPKAEGDVGAYFVLKVAAAGWSSAALVLVDEERAERARQAHIIKPTEPSETSSAAEYEYGDSPFEMVEIALRSVSDWILRAGRYFLGLTERDARARRNGRTQASGTGNWDDEVIYTWSGNPVPLDEIIAENENSE